MPYFDKSVKPTELLTHNNIHVKVIASFSLDGAIKPVYFEYENQAIKIDRVNFSKNNSCFGYNYHCDITVDNLIKNIVLSYHIDNNSWTLDIK